MDNTSVGSDGPAETDSGIESSSTSGASCDSVAYIRVSIPALDVQVSPFLRLNFLPVFELSKVAWDRRLVYCQIQRMFDCSPVIYIRTPNLGE